MQFEHAKLGIERLCIGICNKEQIHINKKYAVTIILLHCMRNVQFKVYKDIIATHFKLVIRILSFYIIICYLKRMYTCTYVIFIKLHMHVPYLDYSFI